MHAKNHNTVVTKRGDSVSNPNRYTSSFETIPTLQMIEEEQKNLGFHPAGYGPPYNIVITQHAHNMFITTWFSQGSCD